MNTSIPENPGRCLADLLESALVKMDRLGQGGTEFLNGHLGVSSAAGGTGARVAQAIRGALLKGAPGGGFILSDQHGEIPWQVPEETPRVIAATAREDGRYPIRG